MAPHRSCPPGRGYRAGRTSALRRSRKFTLKVDPPLDHRFGWLRGTYRIFVAVHYLLPPGCGRLETVAHSPSPGVSAAPATTSKVSPPASPSAPTTTLSPGSKEPERTMLASSLSTRRCIVRLKGLAPNSGSKPSS